jgi:hypothetical protein
MRDAEHRSEVHFEFFLFWCEVLMPWAAPIGTGQGPRNPHALRELRERAPQIPLIVDAGISPRVRVLSTTWIVRKSACSNSWFLETKVAPTASAAWGVMFWLQAIKFIPKALPIRATSDPIRPIPRTPSVFPRRSVPTVCCQAPDRTELLSVTICRAEAKISAQVNSMAGSERYRRRRGGIPAWRIQILSIELSERGKGRSPPS